MSRKKRALPAHVEDPILLPLAFALGLLVFCSADASPGGLNGIQGFFVGFFCTVGALILLDLLGRQRSTKVGIVLEGLPGEAFVERSADGENVTIKIQLSSSFESRINHDR